MPIAVPTPLACHIVRVSGGADRRIATLTAAQYGHVARWQLIRAGVSDDMIQSRLRKGSMTRVTQGMYTLGQRANGPYDDELVALLARPGPGVLSHLTAARVWKICRPSGDRQVDMLIGHNSLRQRERVRVHRTTMVDDLHPTYVYELPVTPVPLTLLQISPLLSTRELERALDEALARRITSLDALHRFVSERAGWPGTPLLKQLLSERIDGAGVTREGVEEALLELLRRAGFPEPRRNVRLGEFSADFYWPHVRMAVEADSYQWHLVKSNYERDRRKDIAFKAQGIDLTRLTWDAITQRPFATVAILATTMAARERRPGETSGPAPAPVLTTAEGIFTTP